MSKNKIILLCFYSCLIQISCRFFICPETQTSPSALDNTDFYLPKVEYDINSINPVIILNKVLINNHKKGGESTKEYYDDSKFCPANYVVAKKEELETIIEYLGDNAFQNLWTQKALI